MRWRYEREREGGRESSPVQSQQARATSRGQTKREREREMGFATSFILYFWLAVGISLLLKSEAVVSLLSFRVQGHHEREGPLLVAGSDAFEACNVLVDLVGFLFVSLSLMTCPNPHGYWMASLTLLAGAAKLHYLDGVALVLGGGEGGWGKGQVIAGAVLILPLVVSSFAVLTHKKHETKDKSQ